MTTELGKSLWSSMEGRTQSRSLKMTFGISVKEMQ